MTNPVKEFIGSIVQDQMFKADKGKTRPDLLQIGFARALRIVQATTDYGAEKYEAHSWRDVPNARERYQAAAERHRQQRHMYNFGKNGDTVMLRDHESGLPHIAHEIFCLLAMMELHLQENAEEAEEYCNFKQPPTAHKVNPSAEDVGSGE